VGRDSSVGIVTCYELDGPGSNAGGGEIFRTLPTDPVAHQASCTVGTEPLAGVKRPGCGANHPPNLVTRFKKDYSCTFSPPPPGVS